MNSLERLRLSTAMVHLVPGAAMYLRCRTGEELTVSGHPSADLGPGAMRAIVIAHARAGVWGCSDLVDEIMIAGSLQHVGAGVHRRVARGVEQRWLATLLPPETVGTMLDDCHSGDLHATGIHGCIRPDRDLGVTCVAITSRRSDDDRFLDAVAAQAMSTLMVEELLRSARQDAPRGLSRSRHAVSGDEVARD
jgi:hypothetical protein